MAPMSANPPPSTRESTRESAEKTRVLMQAAEALERGDFGLARRLLVGVTGLRAAALRRRLRPDPLVGWLVATCLVGFTVIVWLTARR